MAEVSRVTLKTYFETGDTPTQAQFIDLIDSSPNSTTDGTTGTGSYVRATSPTLTTPTIGVATATSVNKVTITAPATSATITATDGTTTTLSGGTHSGTNTGDQSLASLGVTATASELNALDGITSTVTELNYTDGVTSAIQTQLDAKLASTAYDDATGAETTTGTSTTKYVSPDGLAGSNYGIRTVSVLINDGTALTTGDGKAYIRIPDECSGFNLVGARASRVAGTGTLTIQIANVTQAADMLTTKITVDTSETDSSTAAVAVVIDTANDDVATGDRLRIDVDDAGTGTTWAEVQLAFQLP